MAGLAGFPRGKLHLAAARPCGDSHLGMLASDFEGTWTQPVGKVANWLRRTGSADLLKRRSTFQNREPVGNGSEYEGYVIDRRRRRVGLVLVATRTRPTQTQHTNRGDEPTKPCG